MTDPTTQRENFKAAVELLGGSRTAALELGVAERTIGRLCTGNSPLHTGFLRDMAAALIRRADACRALERKISPAFAGNLVDGQPDEDRRRARWQEER